MTATATAQPVAQPQKIRRLLEAIIAHDRAAGRHHLAVRHIAVGLAESGGVSSVERHRAERAALLHDIGKLAIPNRILDKRENLSDEEFAVIQNHSVAGQMLLEKLGGFDVEARLVRHHHERWDGRGYPDGLAGEDIPLVSRILHLADALDVMLQPRRYKYAQRIEDAINEIGQCAGTQFDPLWAERTIRWVAAGGLSSLNDLAAA
jgi:putative nucleotidyltransferase with HDIG domain